MSSLVHTPCRSGWPHDVFGGAHPFLTRAAAVVSAGTCRAWLHLAGADDWPAGAFCAAVATDINAADTAAVTIVEHTRGIREPPLRLIVAKPFSSLWQAGLRSHRLPRESSIDRLALILLGFVRERLSRLIRAAAPPRRAGTHGSVRNCAGVCARAGCVHGHRNARRPRRCDLDEPRQCDGDRQHAAED